MAKGKGPGVYQREEIGGVDFEEVREERITQYTTITLQLDTLTADAKLSFAGTYIYAYTASDTAATVNIKFNEISRKPINFTQGRGVRIPFYAMYVSYAAQAGKTITFVIATESKNFEIFDNAITIGNMDLIKIGGVLQTGFDVSAAIRDIELAIRTLNGDTGTHIAKSAKATLATTIVHTVTAGKMFYLTGMIHNYWNSVAGHQADVEVRNGGDVHQYYLSQALTGVGSGHNNLNPVQPIPIAASFDVTVISGAATAHCMASVFGWEE